MLFLNETQKRQFMRLTLGRKQLVRAIEEVCVVLSMAVERLAKREERDPQ